VNKAGARVLFDYLVTFSASRFMPILRRLKVAFLPLHSALHPLSHDNLAQLPLRHDLR
jgi:hypothetical protein